MIGGKKVLGLIPARGGSKRLPGKNVRPFAGKPLIAWTVEAARQSKYLDRVILSSDDPAIVAAAWQAGCEVPFVRPAELATDAATSIDVVLHALDAIGESFDVLVLLQPTSPLRTASDIDACLELCERAQATSCVSVAPLGKPTSYFGLMAGDGRFSFRDFGDGLAPSEQVCSVNGAVYVASVALVRGKRDLYDETTIGYVMPSERSIDIDNEQEFLVAEALMALARRSDAAPS